MLIMRIRNSFLLSENCSSPLIKLNYNLCLVQKQQAPDNLNHFKYKTKKLTSWFEYSMYPGDSCGVTCGGDGDGCKLVLADRDQGRIWRADSWEPELTFGVRTSMDNLGLAGQCHPGSRHRNTNHAVDLSIQNVSVTHTPAAVLAGVALGAYVLTFGCRDIDTKTWTQTNKDTNITK